MQTENLFHVERVAGDETLLARIVPVALDPGDVFIAGYVGVFAVNALTGPISHPLRRVV